MQDDVEIFKEIPNFETPDAPQFWSEEPPVDQTRFWYMLDAISDRRRLAQETQRRREWANAQGSVRHRR